MISVFRHERTSRIIGDNLLQKIAGGESQNIADDFFEYTSGGQPEQPNPIMAAMAHYMMMRNRE